MAPTLKTIQAEIEAFKRRQRWWQIGFAVAVIVLAILLFTVCSKGKPDESYLLQVQQMDSTIKYQRQQIETLRRYTLAQDSALIRLDKQYKANRPTETRIIHQYEKIPADINRLDREQLRREVANF